MKPAICGVCGTSEVDGNGNCINGHDHWVELEDLDNDHLTNYVNQAVINTGLTVEQLREKLS